MTYKVTFPEEYYRGAWDRMAEKYSKNDLEKNMKIVMSGLEVLTKEQYEVVAKIKAQMVYDFLKETLKGTMNTIIAIQSGKASLGYTTWTQERAAMRELVEGFEFDCLRLADFKKKYGLGA